MSYFSTTLDAIMREQNITQESLAANSKVHATIISRLRKAERAPTREQLAALVVAISPDAHDRGRLLWSHLRDEAEDSLKRGGIDSRHIRLDLPSDDSKARVEEPDWWETAPTSLVCKLEILGKEALKRRSVMSLLDAVLTQIEETQRG